MAVETERKFLVRGDYKRFCVRAEHIVQGYIATRGNRTVRIRIQGDQEGYLTVKGPADPNGLSRFEWETEIPLADARQLMELCDGGIIDKTRHFVPEGCHLFEVDEFHGENEGLTVAELELDSEDETFPTPSWLGEEVTGDRRYYNSRLVVQPFNTWK